MNRNKKDNASTEGAVAGLAAGAATTAGVSFLLNPKFYDLERKSLDKLQNWVEKSKGSSQVLDAGAVAVEDGISAASSGGLISKLERKFLLEAAAEEAAVGSKLPEIILRRFGHKSSFAMTVGATTGAAIAIAYWALKNHGRESELPPQQPIISAPTHGQNEEWKDRVTQEKTVDTQEIER